ncbi:hypothetical protein [Kribbella sp. NPDC051770]|uniref:hypothetical protein n=1 Tax=Kribbella sp. NPDC051770 TaxID=3155413 RepID=UPI003447D3A3
MAVGAGEDLVDRARQYASEYGGLRFSVPGGVLEGQLWLAARRPGVLVRAVTDGSFMFLAADHSDAQCAFMISASGAFGCSWSGEFGQLFDSVEHMLECIALWHAFTGWTYVTVFSGTPGAVVATLGALEADESAAGSTTGWWLGTDVVVVAEPYLTPTASKTPQVTVLARDAQVAALIRQRLRGVPGVQNGFTAASLRSTVGSPA